MRYEFLHQKLTQNPEKGELKPIEFDADGNMIYGQKPEGMPPMMDGERPELPEGEMPAFDGERPELPAGEMPAFGGELPEFAENGNQPLDFAQRDQRPVGQLTSFFR